MTLKELSEYIRLHNLETFNRNYSIESKETDNNIEILYFKHQSEYKPITILIISKDIFPNLSEEYLDMLIQIHIVLRNRSK